MVQLGGATTVRAMARLLAVEGERCNGLARRMLPGPWPSAPAREVPGVCSTLQGFSEAVAGAPQRAVPPTPAAPRTAYNRFIDNKIPLRAQTHIAPWSGTILAFLAVASHDTIPSQILHCLTRREVHHGCAQSDCRSSIFAPAATAASGVVRQGVRVARRYLSHPGRGIRPAPARPDERRRGTRPLLPRSWCAARDGADRPGSRAHRPGPPGRRAPPLRGARVRQLDPAPPRPADRRLAAPGAAPGGDQP